MRIFFLYPFFFTACTSAHGYVKYVTLDNTIYPGFDPHQDTALNATRIVYSWDKGEADGVGPIVNVTTPDIACNLNSRPPALVGKARAGSTATFEWTPWVINHKGPLTAYMAPYEGSLANNNVSKLEFFKIAEQAVTDGKWATDHMMADGSKWNVTIPWDIKPGTYVLRHELLALHFANGGIAIGPPGPQFYIMCAAVEIVGCGSAQPEGNTFPGTYKQDDPGLTYRLYGEDIEKAQTGGYTIAGPNVYVPSGPRPQLQPNPVTRVSPMGDPELDKVYYEALDAEAEKFGEITKMVNNLPMGKGYADDNSTQTIGNGTQTIDLEVCP